MKKALALVLAGMMTLACPVMTFAEETPALDYTMIDESVYEGTWVTAFGVFDLYLPSDWNILVNAEPGEEPENNVYFQAADEAGTRSVGISYSQTDGSMDLEKLAETFVEQGLDEVMIVTINDIPVVTYSIEADGVSTAGIATIGDQGGLYNVTIGAAADDADFQAIGQNILFSFSAPMEEAETEAE